VQPENTQTRSEPAGLPWGDRRVYVVDDDAEVRDSLQFLLATWDISVATYEHGTEFFADLSDLSPGLIILDLRMPEIDGFEFLSRLGERQISWPVIVLSGHGEIAAAVRALKLGAVDFLEKPVEASELESCIAAGFQTLEGQNAAEGSKARAAKLLSSLTPREREVLEQLCQGVSNKQVAFALSISPRTVEMHRANALRSLNVRSVAEVVSLINLAR
jgi:two-component system response regulator FixJ